jgi:3-methylcrotonyl-CoA carboxylase alpha subunit
MFSKLLIANRGEIACRIMRTARRLGMATVAVYSDADAEALHVAVADEAWRIGPAPASQSYLRIEAILEAARRSGAEAIHPGYGFLAENADFAQACADAGLAFVGPPAAAIRAMADKAAAKALLRAAGVPVLAGYDDAAQDPRTLADAAGRIGWPVLIKATAGGGGKGMRIVRDAAAFGAALAAARREAAAAFGDDRVLLERYLERPRHIEVQVFADAEGRCTSLYERDCSVQRRHQKVLEEAPAPGIVAAMRAAMGEAAVAAARAVGYRGAGTVEFIVEDGRFYFMEMNTRLQVEHPVTEAITGLDLVEWQLRVAAGEGLPEREVAIDGHAIEARLYAEDPERDFLPVPGRLVHLALPAGVRVDSGVRPGDAIPPDYDPLIAKIIAHGPDRAAALSRLAAALAATEVAGVRTNLRLLRAIVGHPEFARGGVDTGFIARHRQALLGAASAPPEAALVAAALGVLRQRAGAANLAGDPYSPWSASDCWRLFLDAAQQVMLREGGRTHCLLARPRGEAWAIEHRGTSQAASLREDGGRTLLRCGDLTCPVVVGLDAGRVTVVLSGETWQFELIDPLAPAHAETAGSGRVASPIPGRVAGVLVRPGERVRRGQVLVVIEAMKMELSLTAPEEGVIEAVHCTVGERVEEARELVQFEETP